jgi:phage/plasmid-like protein (TIGR03299 family)
MSHELTIRETGHVEMAYTGETPWHDLGQELQPGAPIEEWITAAGMDWRVLRAKVRYATTRDPATLLREWPDQHVFFRSDTGAPLGIGSDRFQLVQPRATLEFFRDLVEAAGFELSTAGTLFGGRKFWSLAKTNREAIVIDKRDKVRAHLLLATSCDGSMATEAKYVATQVVCNNTLRLASSETGALKVRVTHRSVFDPVAVKRELGIEAATSAFDRTVTAMRRMAETRMSHEAMILATCGLFHPNYAECDTARKDQILRTKPVEPVARTACDETTRHRGLDGTHGTVYGWLNAVTEYIDHSAVAKGGYKTDNRLDSAWFGRGAAVKDHAFAMAGHIVANHAENGGLQSAVRSVNEWIARHS